VPHQELRIQHPTFKIKPPAIGLRYKPAVHTEFGIIRSLAVQSANDGSDPDAWIEKPNGVALAQPGLIVVLA